MAIIKEDSAEEARLEMRACLEDIGSLDFSGESRNTLDPAQSVFSLE
jgi:hypothetical protein